jgi:cytochrome c5
MSKLLKPQAIKLAVILLALSFFLSGAGFSSRAASSQDLPLGKGVEAVRDKCLTCHEADLITQQRLTRAGWVREVDKMIRWGAVVTDAEKELMIDYFTAHFGPRPASPALSAQRTAPALEDRGQQVFESQCLACHEADLTKQQRLTRAGWVREVDKMMRWGATVTEAEKEALVEYLSKNFGPQARP